MIGGYGAVVVGDEFTLLDDQAAETVGHAHVAHRALYFVLVVVEDHGLAVDEELHFEQTLELEGRMQVAELAGEAGLVQELVIPQTPAC